MGIEQEPTVSKERFFTKTDIFKTAGIPINPTTTSRLQRQIDRDVGLAPQTNPKGHTIFSQADFNSLVEFMRLKEKNSSFRVNLESAILPDGSRIIAKKTLHIQQITKIVTEAREKKQTFSLEQIINALNPTPKRSYENKITRKKALDAITAYRKKIKLNGWAIDPITPRDDEEGWKNPQFWFRHENEPLFTPLLDAEALTKGEILLPNGKRIKVEENTLASKIIRRAILAQQNKTHYLDSEISALMESRFHNTKGHKVNFAVGSANRILKKHGLRLVAYETEVNGKIVRAFRIMEEKPTPTSSAEQKSLKDLVRF